MEASIINLAAGHKQYIRNFSVFNKMLHIESFPIRKNACKSNFYYPCLHPKSILMYSAVGGVVNKISTPRS